MSETQPAKSITLKSMLETRAPQFTELLPKGLAFDRFKTAVLACVSRTPGLLKCTPDSVVRACTAAAELGIVPSGSLGGGWLVPFGDQATFILGYRGMIDLARRGGEIRKIEARVVYQGDDFDYAFGLAPRLEHVPCEEDKRGPIRCFYAVALLKEGLTQFEIMNVDQVNRVREMSKAKNAMAWTDHYDEMGRKTVVRRLMKYLPLAPEAAAAIERAEDEEFEDAREVEAVSREDLAPSTVEKLKDKLKGNVTDQHEPGELTNEEQQVWEETEQKA